MLLNIFLQFLVLNQIVRFAVLLALGIRPTMVFNVHQYVKQSIQSPYSNVQSNVNGITFLSQLQHGASTTTQAVGRLCGDLGSLHTQQNQRI